MFHWLQHFIMGFHRSENCPHHRFHFQFFLYSPVSADLCQVEHSFLSHVPIQNLLSLLQLPLADASSISIIQDTWIGSTTSIRWLSTVSPASGCAFPIFRRLGFLSLNSAVVFSLCCQRFQVSLQPLIVTLHKVGVSTAYLILEMNLPAISILLK